MALVNDCLTGLELGTLTTDDLTSYMGRNDNWAGTTTAGHGVFVKRLSGGSTEAAGRLKRITTFERTMREAGLATPPTIGTDDVHRIVVSELMTDVVTGADLAAAGTFTEAMAADAGRLIGELHAAPAAADLDASLPGLPNLGLLQALPLEMYLSSTGAELAFWRVLQSDAVVCDGLRRLRTWEEQAPRVPAHCDLRLDQFLIRDGRVMLTDGEEFRLADPARDIGSYAGEWLFHAVTGLVDVARQAALTDEQLTHEEIVRTGVERLAERRPLITGFWHAYQQCRAVDDQLARRATAFAGWHLMDRAMASASRGARLPAVLRAAMGIGRQAIREPHRFTDTLGLGVAR